MARPFQVDGIKYKKTLNFNKMAKNTTQYNIQAKIKKDKLKRWITFYRRNIHLFIEHYMGIKLHEYQRFWVYNMHENTTSMIIASRCTAKSWLIAVYCIAVSILYPGSKIIIAAKTKGQAGLIVSEKIKGDLLSFPNINREISETQSNNNNWSVKFYNKSSIQVVVSDDRSRGYRSTLNIYEEFRVIPKEMIDSVLSPFLYYRQPPYLKNPKYSKYAENPKKIYISSAYYKTEWIWDEFKKVVKMHYDGKDAMFLGLDYLVSIKHLLKPLKFIEEERIQLEETKFMMEYENIMFGENSNAFFKLNLFKNLRNIKKAFYPLRLEDLDKKGKKTIKKSQDEIRIVSCDLAVRSGGDNTIISCMRLIPTTKGYKREIVYMEAHNGRTIEFQTLRIKQLYADFESDYIVIDIQSFGYGIYERLSSITTDDSRGVEHQAMCMLEDESMMGLLCPDGTIKDLREKTLSYSAIPVICPAYVHSTKQNSEIAKDLRDKLKRNAIYFLSDVSNAENYLLKNNAEFRKACEVHAEDKYVKDYYLQPYKEIEKFIIETVNLEYTISAGEVKIDNKNTKKDRYTSVSYANYFASLLENKFLKQKKKNNGNWGDYVYFPKVNYNVKY